MPAHDHLDDESLEQINKYAQAFREEFEASKDTAPKTLRSKEDVEGQLDEVVPDAVAAIAYTIKHSPNEQLKVKTSQWLLDKKLEVEREGKDPLSKLLTELQERENARTDT